MLPNAGEGALDGKAGSAATVAIVLVATLGLGGVAMGMRKRQN